MTRSVLLITTFLIVIAEIPGIGGALGPNFGPKLPQTTSLEPDSPGLRRQKDPIRSSEQNWWISTWMPAGVFQDRSPPGKQILACFHSVHFRLSEPFVWFVGSCKE